MRLSSGGSGEGFGFVSGASAKGRHGGSGWKIALASVGVCLLTLAMGVPRALGAGARTDSSSGLTFTPGPDSVAVCTSNPCATVTISGTGEALISMDLGIESAASPQPETYYTDLLLLENPTSVTIAVTSLAISGISETRVGDLGRISVFYCASQTDFSQASCEGSYSITSSVGGVAFSGRDTLAPGETRYIEFAGFAGLAAHVGDSIAFVIQVVSQ